MVGKNTKKKAMFLDEVDLTSEVEKFNLRDKTAYVRNDYLNHQETMAMALLTQVPFEILLYSYPRL